MKLDHELQSFTETYDQEVMESIDRLANEFGVQVKKLGMDGFNLVESFDIFSKYLEGYGDYKVKNKDNDKASSQDTIRESVALFIKDHIFKEQKVLYMDFPNLLKAYAEGCNKLLGTVDKVKKEMTENEVTEESIGDVNDFTDQFLEKFHSYFDPMMENVMWASGYNTRKNLINRKTRKDLKTEYAAPVFL